MPISRPTGCARKSTRSSRRPAVCPRCRPPPARWRARRQPPTSRPKCSRRRELVHNFQITVNRPIIGPLMGYVHKIRARLREEQGFTLIELLVVILIIGVLAAIALPAFLQQRQKAGDVHAKSYARTASLAMESYGVGAGDFRPDAGAIAEITSDLQD